MKEIQNVSCERYLVKHKGFGVEKSIERGQKGRVLNTINLDAVHVRKNRKKKKEKEIPQAKHAYGRIDLKGIMGCLLLKLVSEPRSENSTFCGFIMEVRCKDPPSAI